MYVKVKRSCLTNVSKVYELSGNMRFTIVFLVLAFAVITTKARFGRPIILCPCTKILRPVCANNGITYASLCEFECAVKNAKYQGNHNAGL